MSRFVEDGFLSSDLDEQSKQLHQQYHDWFELCDQLNHFAINITSKTPYHSNNRQECLAAALFLRMICLFEASFILIERCMTNEAKVQLRSLIESLFALRAICLDKKVAEEYFQNHLRTRKQALKRLRIYYSRIDQSQLADIDKNIKELDEQIRQGKLPKVSTEYLASKADLNDLYDTAYSVFSWTVHSNIMDVGHTYMAGRSNENIESIFLSVQLDDVEKLFLTATECMVQALKSVNTLFKAKVDDEIENFDKRYKALHISNKTGTTN